MANFVPVLKKTIDGLAQNTPAMREKVYDKARKAFEAKLASISPAPSQAVIDRQKNLLEDAIREVEADYADPGDAVDNSFASIFSDFAPEARATPSFEPPVEQTTAPYLPEPETQRAEPAYVDELRNQYHESESRDYDAPLEPQHDDRADEIAGDDDGSYATYAANEDDDDQPALTQPLRRRTKTGARKRKRGLVAALIGLALLAVAGGAVWYKSNEIGGALGLSNDTSIADTGTGEDDSSAPQSGQAAQPDAPKLTQRLMEDGSEVDEGPAGGQQTLGEGTSIAEASPPETQAESGQPPADGVQTQNDPAVAVGQRAIFYEERTNVAQGSAQSGSVVWSLVQESPGGEGPPEAAIRAEATIPDMDVQLRMTIRRNTDASLPASHILEMIFLTPDGFAGGGIDRVLRVTMKDSEQAPGQQLLGIPAKIADGFFLVALNDSEAERRTNLNLLRRDNWIDVPMIYKSGRRALITVEKGVPGEAIFQQALDAWEQADQQSSN